MVLLTTAKHGAVLWAGVGGIGEGNRRQLGMRESGHLSIQAFRNPRIQESRNPGIQESRNDVREAHRFPYLLNQLRALHQLYCRRGSLLCAQDFPQRATIAGNSVRHLEVQKHRGYGIDV